MGVSFDVSEPSGEARVSDEFRCGRPDSAPIDVFRMLTGTANIVRKTDASVVKCRYDYIRLCPSRPVATDRKLAKGLFGEDVNVDDAKQYVSRLSTLYRAFFIKLEVEVQHCLYWRHRSRHVEAFLHFYRALEKLAVAFPVLFITAQPDFERVHTMLKPLFAKDGSGGELSFVNNFCKHLAEKSDVLGEYRISISFDRNVPGNHDLVFREVERVVPTLKDSLFPEETHFDIAYKDAATLLIECRNRLFHNSNSGQSNFNIDKIGGAEGLCQGLVQAGLHWLALTYLEVVRNRAAQLNSWV